MIERNVWIAAGATIIGGVTVGENSVVAAGSVVTKDVPPNTLTGEIRRGSFARLAPNQNVIAGRWPACNIDAPFQACACNPPPAADWSLPV